MIPAIELLALLTGLNNQAKLAAAMGIHESTVSEYLSGTRKIGPTAIRQFAKAFQVPPEHLAASEGLSRADLAGDVRGKLAARAAELAGDLPVRHLRPVIAFTQPFAAPVMLPLVGRVAAGLPVLAEQNIEDHVPVPGEAVPRGRVCFVAMVTGDSMEGADIFDRDHVLCLHEEIPRDGDIVIATTGSDETTIKRWVAIDEETFVLRADTLADCPNTYPDIPVDEHTRVHGVVTGTMRYNPVGRGARK